MELWIVRHGEAQNSASDERGPSLSEYGRTSVEKVGVWLKRQDKPVGTLLASPLRRAQETAAILNEDWQLEIQTVDWLKPGIEPSRILNELKNFTEDRIALVGHLPTLGWLISTMVWGLPPKEIILPTASVSSLKVQHWEPSGAHLNWVFNPELEV